MNSAINHPAIIRGAASHLSKIIEAVAETGQAEAAEKIASGVNPIVAQVVCQAWGSDDLTGLILSFQLEYDLSIDDSAPIHANCTEITDMSDSDLDALLGVDTKDIMAFEPLWPQVATKSDKAMHAASDLFSKTMLEALDEELGETVEAIEASIDGSSQSQKNVPQRDVYGITEARRDDGATVFSIRCSPDCVELIEKRVKRLAKDAARAEMPELSVQVVGSEMVATGNDAAREIAIVEVVTYLDRNLNGYEIRAIIRRTDEGNLIEHVDVPDRDAQPIPARFRGTGMVDHCDHCNKKRNRRYGVVVHNTLTDEWSQLGGSCLAKAMGLAAASSVNALLRFRRKVQDSLRDPELVKPVVEKAYTGVSTALILSYLAASIREKGWKSSSTFSPTYSDGLSRYHIDHHLAKNTPADQLGSILRPYQPKAEDRAEAREAMSWANGLTDEDCSGTGGDLHHNLRTVAANCYVSARDIGWAARLVREYQRSQQSADEAEVAMTSANVAKVGDIFGAPVDGKGGALRRTQSNDAWPTLAAKLTSVLEWRGRDGRTTKIVKFRTDDNCILVWWCPIRAWSSASMREGGEYMLNCLVRKHGAYRGDNQTTITWVSVASTADANRTRQHVGGDYNGRELELDPKTVAENVEAVATACNNAIDGGSTLAPDYMAIARAAKQVRETEKAAKKARK